MLGHRAHLRGSASSRWFCAKRGALRQARLRGLPWKCEELLVPLLPTTGRLGGGSSSMSQPLPGSRSPVPPRPTWP